MKKFSKITSQKIGEEPKAEVKPITEEDLFKGKLMNLMDQLLSVRSYGPVDKHQRAGLLKVAGKEMLIEAILDLLSEKNNKESVKILEGLKTKITDWQVIDEEIDQLMVTKPSLANRNKIKSIFEKYGEGDSLIPFVESTVDKIVNTQTLKDYIKIVDDMKIADNIKESIKNIYQSRLKQLEF